MVCNVHHTAKSASMVCIIAQSHAPRCASYRGVKLLGVVCITPQSQTAHRGVKKKWWSLVAFKGIIRRNPFWGDHIYHERKVLKIKMLIYYRPKILTPRCHAHLRNSKVLNFVIEYRNQNRLWKYLNLFIRGPRWVRIIKNGGRDLHTEEGLTCPLRPLNFFHPTLQLHYTVTISLIDVQ